MSVSETAISELQTYEIQTWLPKRLCAPDILDDGYGIDEDCLWKFWDLCITLEYFEIGVMHIIFAYPKTLEASVSCFGNLLFVENEYVLR